MTRETSKFGGWPSSARHRGIGAARQTHLVHAVSGRQSDGRRRSSHEKEQTTPVSGRTRTSSISTRRSTGRGAHIAKTDVALTARRSAGRVNGSVPLRTLRKPPRHLASTPQPVTSAQLSRPPAPPNLPSNAPGAPRFRSLNAAEPGGPTKSLHLLGEPSQEDKELAARRLGDHFFVSTQDRVPSVAESSSKNHGSTRDATA